MRISDWSSDVCSSDLLAQVLESLAESVSADVRACRQIEADRAKPRATARWVTIISVGVLVVLAISGTYVEPYRSPLGQVILVTLLRSEEHTSELQSLMRISYAVFCVQKKKYQST